MRGVQVAEEEPGWRHWQRRLQAVQDARRPGLRQMLRLASEVCSFAKLQCHSLFCRFTQVARCLCDPASLHQFLPRQRGDKSTGTHSQQALCTGGRASALLTPALGPPLAAGRAPLCAAGRDCCGHLPRGGRGARLPEGAAAGARRGPARLRVRGVRRAALARLGRGVPVPAARAWRLVARPLPAVRLLAWFQRRCCC